MAYSCNWVQLWLTDGGFALLDISCPLTSCTTTASRPIPLPWPVKQLWIGKSGVKEGRREGARSFTGTPQDTFLLLLLPSRYSYQWPGGGEWAFLPFAYSFSKHCIDRVSDIRIAKIDVMQNTKYYLRISHEYFWITQLWNYQLKITTAGAEWDRADTATRAGQSHDRGKLEKIRP